MIYFLCFFSRRNFLCLVLRFSVLDGKTVLVLAVKGDKSTPTVKYSFAFRQKLVDVVAAALSTITIRGHTVAVKISAVALSAITTQKWRFARLLSGKADKVANATAGNIATLDANGNLADSGVTFATDAQTTANSWRYFRRGLIFQSFGGGDFTVASFL